jgi:hypothetical protein
MANDRSEYLNDGFRDGEKREGFGDDGGARVGRPDGAGSNASPRDPNQGGHEGGHEGGHQGEAHRAPHDAEGHAAAGQAGTNTSPVDAGLEGSLTDGDDDAAQGQQQSRVQSASEGVNPGRAAGDERRVFDL